MTFEILFVLGLIALAFVLFISERFSLDVTALLILSILFVGGFLTVEEAISGFANPAVTISRLFTDTFTGIAPESLIYFLCGQIVGCIIANYTFNIFDKK